MKALHVINKQSDTGPGLRNLRKSESEDEVYFSGFWDIPLAETTTLIGGMLFLHETKAKASRFGGRVLAVEQVEKDEFAHAKRIEFKVKALREGRGVKWRGADHAMASYGTIIEVDN